MSLPTQRSDSIARNAVFALGSQATSAAFTAVITLFLVRALDPTGYGVFVLALSIATIVAFPADFGVSLAAARFIAERRGDARAVAAVLARALGLKLVLMPLVAAALIALAGPIASLYDQPDLASPLRAVAIALVGQNLVFLVANTFVAMGRVSWQFVLILCEAAIEATATIGFVLLAGGATAAMLGRAVGYCVGALIGAALILRLVGRRAFSERRGGPRLRHLGTYAGALLIVDGAYAVFSQVDVLLVGGLLGATAAGVYGAPIKLAVLVNYTGLSLAQAIAPRLASHPDHPPDVPALAGGVRLLLIVQLPIAVAIAVWATPIADLVLGPGYEDSAAVLRALAPFMFLSGIGPLASTAVNYVGEARRRVPIAIGCAVLNVVLAVALIEAVGITGAAISVDVTYGIYVGAHIWICRRLLGLPIRPLVATVGRTLPAGIALAGLLVVLGTDELTALAWVTGIVGGAGVFVGSLILAGETSVAELRGLVTAARQRLRPAN